MPHKRLREDWSQRGYKFWVKPGTIPDWVWSTAREMQTTWNMLVDLRQETFDKTKDKEKAEKKPYWDQFWIDAEKVIKQSNLNWEAKGEMADRFKTAHSKAIKEKAMLSKQRGLRRILIPHRYTQGGLPLKNLFENSGYRCKITLPDLEAYAGKSRAHFRQRLTIGSFGMDKQNVLPFKIMLHRRIHPDAFVKKVAWVGDFDRRRPDGRQWEWSLVVTAEEPPPEIVRHDTKMAAIDLGWRVMGEGAYIRIGMIADTDGNMIELRLPLAYRQKWRKRLPPDWMTTYNDLIRLSERAGHAVENCKETLKGQLDTVPAGFANMRNNGLRRLKEELDPDSDAYKTIDTWQAIDKKIWCVYQGLDRKLRQRRTSWYRKLASWLTKHYRVIAWEGDLSLKEMSEATKGNVILKNAAHYRVWAGLYDLRRFLKEATAKNLTTLLDRKSAFTTIPCSSCGELMGASGSLIIECQHCGTRWDQDENAARNLLSSIGQLDPIPIECMKTASVAEKIKIPYWLEAVAVPISR